MKKLILYLFTICLGIATMSAQSVTGVVTGADDGQPLPGVNIKVKGTDQGTITDMDGNYSIDVTGEDAVLIFSFVGFITQEQTVGSQTAINVVLEVDSKGLDEVVVIGYGTIKKSLKTGATSSVDVEQLKNRSSANVEDAMQGLTPGVTLTPESGMPGSATKVRIRGIGTNGNANPLYIVDGIKVGDINDLAPEDVENVEVLKDAASSAIYGSEGGNGVIIITTKQGKQGKGQIAYNFRYGIQSLNLNKLPKSLSSDEYIQWQTQMNSSNPAYTPLSATGYSTDWLDEIFETAPLQSHNLSFSGGNESSTYYTSFNYYTQDGVIGGDKANYERFNARLNLSHKINNWAKVSVNAQYAKENRSTLSDQDEYGGVIASALGLEPLTPVSFEPGTENSATTNAINDGEVMYKDSQGRYYSLSDQDLGEAVNPFIQMAIANGGWKHDKFIASFSLELTPFKGFTFISRPSIDWKQSNEHFWDKPYYASPERGTSVTKVTDNNQRWYQWMWENFATYTRSFAEHNISATLGMSVEKGLWTELKTSSSPMNVVDPVFAEHDYTGSDNNSLNGYTNEDRMISYFGRVSYDYKGRYMLTATLRSDLTSTAMVPKDNIVGIFPSFSAGWNVSEESFFPKGIVNFLKLRGSWGQNGSISSISDIGRFRYRSVITTQDINIIIPDGSGGEIYFFGAEPTVLPNPDLTWETSEQTDFGFDLHMLDSKVTVGFDWYKKVTKDLLISGSVPTTSGNWAPIINAGDVENTGIEVVLGYKNFDKDFKYGANFNFATLKNEVTKINSPQPRINGANIGTGWGGATVFEEGEPIWYFRGYETAGVNETTGEPIYVDQNGDGEITEEDKTNLGDPHPDFTFGGRLFVEYKGFDFNFVLQGQTGGQVIMGWMRPDRLNSNVISYFYDDRWTPENTSASMPAATSAAEFYQSDFLVRDADFLRVKQIQLGYSLSKSLIQRIGLSKVRLYVSLDDFFTFTKYEGMDPIAGSTNNNSQGIDRGVYPTPRKVMFGINVSL